MPYCDVRSTFRRPLHPYTAGLQASLPTLGLIQDRLRVIPGTVPSDQSSLESPAPRVSPGASAHSSEVPSATISPEGGILEADGYVLFTITANEALMKTRWDATWEPPGLFAGAKTFQDSTKLVLALHGRSGGAGVLRVFTSDRDVAQARVFVRPALPSRTPMVLSGIAAAAMFGGAVAANSRGKGELRDVLLVGAGPLLTARTVISWFRYRQKKLARERFLLSAPPFDAGPAEGMRKSTPSKGEAEPVAERVGG